MMASLKELINTTYAKLILGSLIIFLGIASGIYVGFIVLNKTEARDLPNDIKRLQSYRKALYEAGMYLKFTNGDLFPYEDCIDEYGNKSNFENVLKDKKAIIIFSAFDCKKCYELNDYWKSVIEPVLDNDIFVYHCINKKDAAKLAEQESKFLDGKRFIIYDENLFKRKYNMQIIPTIVAIDEFGFVSHSQIGFADIIDPEIMLFVNNK